MMRSTAAKHRASTQPRLPRSPLEFNELVQEDETYSKYYQGYDTVGDQASVCHNCRVNKQLKRFNIKQRQLDFVDIAFLVPIDRYGLGATFEHVIMSLTCL